MKTEQKIDFKRQEKGLKQKKCIKQKNKAK